MPLSFISQNECFSSNRDFVRSTKNCGNVLQCILYSGNQQVKTDFHYFSTNKELWLVQIVFYSSIYFHVFPTRIFKNDATTTLTFSQQVWLWVQLKFNLIYRIKQNSNFWKESLFEKSVFRDFWEKVSYFVTYQKFVLEEQSVSVTGTSF